ncbi:MAG: hypothetical protein WDA60_01825 [Acidimicrobiia bacterium]
MPFLVDAYRFARNPAQERAIHRDLRRARAASRFLSDLPAVPADAPAVLVGLYRDDLFDTKVGLVLASALRAHGARPVLLTPSARNQRIRRYAQAFGITDVRARDRVELTDAETETIRAAADAMLAGPIDFEHMRAWTFAGYQVGYHVVSTLIRRTFDGSPDLHLDANRALVADILHEVLRTYSVCGRVLDEVAPTLVLVEEANYAHNGPLVDVAVARGIDVIQTIVTWRDDALMSKRLTTANRRVDAKSVAPETLERLDATGGFPPAAALDAELDADFVHRYDGRWALSVQFQPDTRAFTDTEIVETIGLDPAKPTAVVFAHVLWDATLFFGVDLFDNYADWLRQTVLAAAANTHVNWVIKTHPSNVFRSAHGDVGAGASSEGEIVREALPSPPDHVHVLAPGTPINSVSLYRFADYGVTVRGTAGLEMACFAKPVLTAGTGAYSGLGFTIDSPTRAAYLERIATIQTLGPVAPDATVRARRYAHTLFVRRPWVARSFRLRFEFLERGWHPLDRNLDWTLATASALADSPDLGHWAAWALRSSETDFLAPVAAADAAVTEAR